MKEEGGEVLYRCGTLTYTRLGLLNLFIWLLWGDFAWSMKDRAVGSVATLMVKSFGVSDFTYGLLILSFPNFTNAILGPLVSFRSDRHRGRWGRRIPFLMKTTPFVVVGLIGLGFTPMLGNWLSAHIGADRLSVNMASLLVFGFFWILLDFGSVLVHLFQKDQREYYNLERLWNDAQQLDISDLLTD